MTGFGRSNPPSAAPSPSGAQFDTNFSVRRTRSAPVLRLALPEPSGRTARFSIPRFRVFVAVVVIVTLIASMGELSPRVFSKEDVRKVVIFTESASNDVRHQVFWTEPSRIPFYVPRSWLSSFRGKVTNDAALRNRLCRFAEDLSKEDCTLRPSPRCRDA
jgi:hypothetical protein